FLGGERAERFSERLTCRGVVSRVEEKLRTPRDELESPRPPRHSKALGDRLVRDLKACTPQEFDRGEGETRVRARVGAEKRCRRGLRFGEDRLGADRTREMSEDRPPLARIADERWLSAPKNSGFLVRDRLDRIAKDRGMLESDVGNARKDGLDDIRRIEASAKAHFEDRKVHLRFAKRLESNQRHGLEKAELTKRFVLKHTLDERAGGFITQRLAIDADALSESMKMRRSKKSGSVACFSKDTLDQRNARPLAIAPSDGDRRERPLRVAA